MERMEIVLSYGVNGMESMGRCKFLVDECYLPCWMNFG